MIFEPEYTNFKKRLFIGLIQVLAVSIIFTLMLFGLNIKLSELIIMGAVLGLILFVLIISVVNKTKRYLNKIEINEEKCSIEIYEYDEPGESLINDLNQTRIKIYELLFPFTRIGRNYKLIIETKQGISYKKIFEQHEIGGWNLEKFKEVIKNYSEIKGVSSPTSSFTRTNFWIDK